MPYYLNGVYLATTDDLNSLERSVSLLDRSVKRLDDLLRQRVEEFNHSLRTLEKTTEEHLRLIRMLDKRATDLEKALRDAVDDLNRTLDQISTEVETSTGYLEEVNQHLDKNDTAMLELNGQLKLANEQEVNRRTQASENFEALLKQQKIAAGMLAKAFSDLQAGFADLITAEEENTRLLEHSIRLVREALIDVQSQTQEELNQSIDALQIYRQAKQDRNQEENLLFNRLLEVQESMRQHLASLESIAADLEKNTTQAESDQINRLMDHMKNQARSLNQEALALMMRGEAGLAATLLDTAVQMDPESLELVMNQILAHLQAGHLQQADDLLKPNLSADPLNARLLHLSGMILLANENIHEAIEKLESASELDNQDGEIFFSLGKAYYAAGQIQPALLAWETSARLEPQLAAADPVVRILLEEKQQQEKPV